MVDFFFFFLSRQAKSLRWSQDHFSNILTQAACCVVCKSPIFFLREINTAHYLAEKRSLCQAAAHSTGRQPPSGLSHFSKMDNRLIAFVLNYPFWTKTAPLRRPISFPQAAKELLHKWTPPALGKMGTGGKKKTTLQQNTFYTAGIMAVSSHAASMLYPFFWALATSFSASVLGCGIQCYKADSFGWEL